MADERVFVGLGANLGDARAAVQQAIADIAALPQTQLIATSSLYRTAPVDAGGPDFINAAIELRTALEPLPLLRALQAIELKQGRERPYRNAPRTLDLDVLLYGQRVLAACELTLPHPRLHQRAFALEPVLQLAPELAHPLLGPLATLAARIHDQPIERLP